jgi:hypothetical protein
MESEVFASLWEPYRHELKGDWVSLSELVRRVQREMPELDDLEARRVTLELIEEALVRGEAEAGTGPVSGHGLAQVWREPSDEIVARIDQEWGALTRPLQPGDVVWFDRPRS